MATTAYPLGKFGSIIGRPGQGTHSYTAPPNNWESDSAYDLAVPRGTPVYAIESGSIGSAFGYENTGGYRLHLATASDEFYYAHLSGYAAGIHAGSAVQAGDLLGYSGDTGNARGTTPHLHIAEREGTGVLAGLVGAGNGGTAPPPATPPPSTGSGGGGGTSSGSGGSGVASAVCDIAECYLCDKTPGPDWLKRANPLCIACNACRDAARVGGRAGDVADAISSVPDALGFIFSVRFLEILGGGALLLLGIALLGKQLGADVPIPSLVGRFAK